MRQQRGGGALVPRREIETRRRRGCEREAAGELLDAAFARLALDLADSAAGADEIGQRRAAQIDDEIPARPDDGGIEAEPVQRPAPLLDDDQPVETRHRLEERRRRRPGGDGEARIGVALDQMAEHAGRQHGIADPRRGDEQNFHCAGVIQSGRRLAKDGSREDPGAAPARSRWWATMLEPGAFPVKYTKRTGRQWRCAVHIHCIGASADATVEATLLLRKEIRSVPPIDLTRAKSNPSAIISKSG